MILVNIQVHQTGALALRLIQTWMAHQVAVDPDATHRVVPHGGAAQGLVHRTTIAILAPIAVHHPDPAEDHVHPQDLAPATVTLAILAQVNLDLNRADAPVHHLQVLVKVLIPATMIPETICILPEKSPGAHLQAPMTGAYVAIADAKVAVDEMISTMRVLFIRRQKARTVEAALGDRSRRDLQTSL
jgi:hypothetical protein